MKTIIVDEQEELLLKIAFSQYQCTTVEEIDTRERLLTKLREAKNEEQSS